MFGLVDSIAGSTIAPQLPYTIATVVYLDSTLSYPSILYITQKTLLPQIQLIRPIEIYQIICSPKAVCLYCCWYQTNHRRYIPRIITKSNNILKLQIFCSYCNISLCKVCFLLFYYTVA